MSNPPSDIPASYYGFGEYVDRARWLTYYAQLSLLTETAPERVLEVGVGPGVVGAVLRDRGARVETVDVNPSLHPDHVADLRALPTAVTEEDWDWILCSRVLHHIPHAEVGSALDALARLRARRTLITVPQEDLSVQTTIRRTAGRTRHLRISGGAKLKRALRQSVIQSKPSGLWMLNGDHAPTRGQFRTLLQARFTVEREFTLPDDPSHMFFVVTSSAA